MIADLKRRLVNAAAVPYRSAGRYAWHFARGKLGGDPIFMAMLGERLLPASASILDLGCGEGLLANWLHTAGCFHARGDWPPDWPAPPRLVGYRGIELQGRDVARAQRALPADIRVEQGDIRAVAFGRANAVVILDVLHYITPRDQGAVLERVRACLEPGGRLLLRVGDADAGWRFRTSLAVDSLVIRLRGQRLGRLHCRSLSAWEAELADRGFQAHARPMSAGTPFANHLLIARTG